VTLAGATPAADTRFRVPNADRLHGFREPEVEHLDGAVGSELDVGRFQIAMNDPRVVNGFERVRDPRRK
jgi:hypothetical protein